ncbi:MAG: PAS domain-containing protein [Actinobacteria bacterium]|nr:PAS domain-containing protein [Actinomycetota bacterium]
MLMQSRTATPVAERMSADLLRSRNVLRAEIEAMPIPMIVVDGHRRIRYANPAARDLTSLDLSVQELRQADFSAWAQRLGGGVVADQLRLLAERLAAHPHGTEVPSRELTREWVCAAPLRASGRVSGHVVLAWPVGDGHGPHVSDAMTHAAEEAQHKLAELQKALNPVRALLDRDGAETW